MKKKIPTFLELFRAYIAHHSNSNIVANKRHHVTLTAYRNKYSILSEYLFQKTIINLQAIEFTVLIADDLFDYLSGKYKHNYAARVVEICRAVLDHAARKMLIKYNPIAAWKATKIKAGEPLHLIPSEIIKLENYTSGESWKTKAKDMFLFQCYTGFDYGDLTTISIDHLIWFEGRYILKKKRNKKCGGIAPVPYFEKTKALFEKYNYNMNLLSNPKYNAHIKIVAAECGIRKHLTTHIGRKTFAMIKLNYEGYSMEAVSLMLGHKTTRTTEETYAQVNINLLSRELRRLGL